MLFHFFRRYRRIIIVSYLNGARISPSRLRMYSKNLSRYSTDHLKTKYFIFVESDRLCNFRSNSIENLKWRLFSYYSDLLYDRFTRNYLPCALVWRKKIFGWIFQLRTLLIPVCFFRTVIIFGGIHLQANFSRTTHGWLFGWMWKEIRLRHRQDNTVRSSKNSNLGSSELSIKYQSVTNKFMVSVEIIPF